MEEITNALITGVITLLGTIVSALSVYLTTKIKKWLEAKTTEKEYKTISEYVTKAINVVEAKYKDAIEKPLGETKKAEAIAIIKNMCAEKGITVSDETLTIMVDGAVAELNNVFYTITETITESEE